MASTMPQSKQAFTMPSTAEHVKNLSDGIQFLSDSFLRLAFHSSTIVGSTLFIDGGEITLRTGSTLATVTQNKTLTVDLSSSWTASQVKYDSINKDASVPILNFGGAWTSSDQVSMFSFGGVRSSLPYSPIIANIEIWEYSTANGWSGLTSQSPTSPTLTNSRPAFAASAYGNGIGYMLSGIRGNSYAPWSPLPGLLTYNMAENTWTNESTIPVIPYGAIGGSLTFVPGFGKEGILLAMGGEYTGSRPWMEMATNFVPFTNISIWDVAAKTWYWQNTTARNSDDTPPSAIGFCSAGVSGQNGSFEIFIYGGHDDTFILSSKTPSDIDRTAQEIFNSVYVLSLPGFLWTRVNTGIASPRTGHTCETVGNRQMLSIGGLNPTYRLEQARGLLDDFSQGLGILDMVDLEWSSSYNANAAKYTTPGIIQDWYDADGLGSLVWSSAEVEALFNHSTNITTSLPAASTGTTTNIVIPATVGAIFGTIIVAALVAYLYRRHRSRRSQNSPTSDSTNNRQDTLAKNLQNYLTRTRERYLTQRRTFIDQTAVESNATKNDLSRSASPPKNQDTRFSQTTVSGSPEHSNRVQTAPSHTTPKPPPFSLAQYPDHPAFSSMRFGSNHHREENESRGRAQPPDPPVQSGPHQMWRAPDTTHTPAKPKNQGSHNGQSSHKVSDTRGLSVTTRSVGIENQRIHDRPSVSGPTFQGRTPSNGNRHRNESQHRDIELQELE